LISIDATAMDPNPPGARRSLCWSRQNLHPIPRFFCECRMKLQLKVRVNNFKLVGLQSAPRAIGEPCR
jgi:hypothetical protein